MTRYVIERGTNPIGVLVGFIFILLLPSILIGALVRGDLLTALICAFFLALVFVPIILLVLLIVLAIVATPVALATVPEAGDPPDDDDPGTPLSEREADDPRFWTPKNGVWL